MAGQVHVIDHPLVQHKLTLMRTKEHQHQQRSAPCSREISMLLAYEVSRDLPLHDGDDRDADRAR